MHQVKGGCLDEDATASSYLDNCIIKPTSVHNKAQGYQQDLNATTVIHYANLDFIEWKLISS